MTTAEISTEMVPYQVATDTFVVPWLLQAPPVGFFCMNSMVIRGAEPMIVDTGSPASRDAWLDAVWSLVDPGDVRWIFLSHDDRDHSGNLLPVLEACPNATLLTTWFSVGRMADEWMIPLDRCRFVNEGDRIDARDRSLVALRPPLFDNPTTRGLFDERTGVLWGVDTFALTVPGAMEDVSDLSDEHYREGQLFGAQLVAPWHQWLDQDKFSSHVNTVASLPIEVIASCHAPAIRGPRVEAAFDLLHQVPAADPWSPFTQHDLQAWMTAMHAEPAPALI